MKWFAYSIEPIDFGWEHLIPVPNTLANLVKNTDENGDIDSAAIQDFLKAWDSAKTAAKQVGWEGDHRHDPAVFWLPSGGEFQIAFVIKQDNNGNTFVISPHALPWLKKHEI